MNIIMCQKETIYKLLKKCYYFATIISKNNIILRSMYDRI